MSAVGAQQTSPLPALRLSPIPRNETARSPTDSTIQRALETMVFAYCSSNNLEPSGAAAEAVLERLNRKAKG